MIYLMFEKVKRFKGKMPRWASVIALLISPLSIFLLCQYVYNGYFSLYSFSITLINYVIISFILWLIVFLTNKYSWAIIFGHIACLIFAIACYFVDQFRGNPVLPWDLTALKTAGDVMMAYKYYPTVPMIIACIYVVVISILIMYCFKKRPLAFNRDTFGTRAIALIICILTLTIISSPKCIESYGAKTDVWDQGKAYSEGGILAVFLSNMQFLDVEVPDGYSEEVVDEILDSTTDQTVLSDVKPNIIAIMNESWSDLESFGGLEFSEDVLAKTRSIEGIHFGYVYTSVFGAGTSASEFEFLTGNSMAFLPSGSIPYQQYVLDDTPSLASILKQQGYDTMAFHPGDSSSWNRDKAYPLMGFESFKAREDMNVEIKESHGGYVSDKSDFAQIIYDFEDHDKSKPLFYFNVTIQSHGGYQDTTYENKVTVKGHEGEFFMAEQYLTLVKETDEAFYDLVEYFKSVDEPVIIVMFGDHEPALEEEFYELAYDNGEEVSMAEYLNKFKTPYVIWANYDIGDVDFEDMSLNYLGQSILELTGLDTTRYGDYLLSLKDELPVISFPGYFDKEYNAYSHLETNGYTKMIEEYQMVQYKGLFTSKDERYYDLD